MSAEVNIARRLYSQLIANYMLYSSKSWRALLARLHAERGSICEQCGGMNCEIFGEHIVELKDGGAPLDERNIILLCGSCYTAKREPRGGRAL